MNVAIAIDEERMIHLMIIPVPEVEDETEIRMPH